MQYNVPQTTPGSHSTSLGVEECENYNARISFPVSKQMLGVLKVDSAATFLVKGKVRELSSEVDKKRERYTVNLMLSSVETSSKKNPFTKLVEDDAAEAAGGNDG